jgi:GT2 family glycosyltransferase
MNDFDLSICIVTLQARDYLKECLKSISENTHRISLEIIVVDNGSCDGTQEMLASEFPYIHLIQNLQNEGFSRPMNKALHASQGRYLLLLNPDTVVQPHAFEVMMKFMDENAEVGICGPKLLNQDGSMQKQCRRSAAGPWDTFTYISGLAGLFPKSELFGGYLMTYKDEDVIHEAEAVSGACMLIRREVVEQIGYLDERFFAYQEDADYCFQARKAGWKVIYFPEVKIIHYGGRGGTRVFPLQAILEWHRSYWLYYRKNFAREYFFLFNWFYYTAMGVKFLSALLINLIKKERFAGPRRP